MNSSGVSFAHIAKCQSCFKSLEFFDEAGSKGIQYCCCGIMFCSTDCFNSKAGEHDHFSTWNTMVTIFPCNNCDTPIDITQIPSKDFLFCECSLVFCSNDCWEVVKGLHLQHLTKSSGFPCYSRSYLTNKNRCLYLEDLQRDCSCCEEKGQKLNCFCEDCQDFFCNENCLRKHPCLSDSSDEESEGLPNPKKNIV